MSSPPPFPATAGELRPCTTHLGRSPATRSMEAVELGLVVLLGDLPRTVEWLGGGSLASVALAVVTKVSSIEGSISTDPMLAALRRFGRENVGGEP